MWPNPALYNLGSTPCQTCAGGQHKPHVSLTWCQCPPPCTCTCTVPALGEVTQPWGLPAQAVATCSCDIRFGCTCPAGKAELERERAARRERDKRRGDYT